MTKTFTYWGVFERRRRLHVESLHSIVTPGGNLARPELRCVKVGKSKVPQHLAMLCLVEMVKALYLCIKDCGFGHLSLLCE